MLRAVEDTSAWTAAKIGAVRTLVDDNHLGRPDRIVDAEQNTCERNHRLRARETSEDLQHADFREAVDPLPFIPREPQDTADRREVAIHHEQQGTRDIEAASPAKGPSWARVYGVTPRNS